MSEYRKLGREFARGVTDHIAVLAVYIFIISLLWLVIKPTDDCDRSKFDRCEMKILVDNKTGVEYLSDGKGGLVRRGAQ